MPSVLDKVTISWTGFFVTLGAFVAVLFLRRLLLGEHTKRGRATLLILALSLVARLVSGLLIELDVLSASKALGFIAILLMGFGITGVVALIVFDIGLARVRVFVQPLVRDLIQALALLVITLVVLRVSGVDLFSLFTTSAVLTAVIGLALQSTIANVFAGLSLQTDKTISIGDWVRINDHTGQVREIKWRSTKMVTMDGDYVIMPNSFLLQNPVVNFTRPSNEHRVWLRIRFAYRHPPNEVRRIMLEAIRHCPGVLETPSPDCFPVELAESAIVYTLRYWITDISREAPIDGEVRTRLWYAAQREGLEIPFPIRNVFMTEVTEEQQQSEREREIQERVAAIAKLDLFAPLTPEERALVARSMKVVSFANGEEIIQQGEPGDSLYVIQRGSVGVKLTVEGAEREVATLKAGDFFGEMSLITGEPRTATVVAKSDVACYLVEHHAFRRVIETKPEVAEQVAARLGTRQAALEGERDQLSAEARANRAAEKSGDLLKRIRKYFNLG